MIPMHRGVAWRVAPAIGSPVIEPFQPLLTAVSVESRRRSTGLPVPFLTTSASADLALWWLLLPFWWAAGVEQAAGGLLLFTCARTLHGSLPMTLRLLLVFLGVYVLSGLFIVESYRYVTFARGLSAYVGAFAVGYTAFVACRLEGRADRVVAAFIAAMTLSAATAIVGAYGLWRPEFASLIAELFPGSWIETSYGSAIAWRSVGQEAWFLDVPFYRARGMFLFATMSATAMAAAIPLAVYGMLRAGTRWRRVFSGGAVVLLGAALLASTGRVAALGLASGGGVMLVALLVKKRWTRTAFAIVAVTALVGAVQYIGPAGVLNLADQLVYARGDGSVTSRTEVYRATLSGIAERPVLGWGTERDVEGLLYPAGSHSYYLGVAYKHGIVGLCVLAALCWRLWRDSTPTGAEHPKTRTLLMCARWTFIAVAVNAITDAPDLDAITLQAFWTVAGIAIGAAGLVRAHEASSPARRVYRPLAGDPA